MIQRVMRLVITFYTTTDAMAMEHTCKCAGADGRLIPVPRSITAGCGLAWCAKVPPKTDRSWWRVLTKHSPLEKGMANPFGILALKTP